MQKQIIKNTIFYMVFLFFSLISFQSFAWDFKGHNITTYIADHYLTDNSKKQISSIYALDSISDKVIFPDELKYLSRPMKWVEGENLNWNTTFTWHFNANYQEKSIKHANQAIDEAILILKNKNSTDIMKYNALLILTHVIGDIYQPLHLDLMEGQMGANDINVTWCSGAKTNLHKIWDYYLLSDGKTNAKEYAQFLLNKYNNISLIKIDSCSIKDKKCWKNGDPLLSKKIYASAKDGDTLCNAYKNQYIDIMNHQLLKAGQRIAVVLNDIFK